MLRAQAPSSYAIHQGKGRRLRGLPNSNVAGEANRIEAQK
jgi:hypothetical protein